jgi:hypothetical protein
LSTRKLSLEKMPTRWGETTANFTKVGGQYMASLSVKGNSCVGSIDGAASMTNGVIQINLGSGDVCKLAVIVENGGLRVFPSQVCQKYAGFQCSYEGVISN